MFSLTGLENAGKPNMAACDPADVIFSQARDLLVRTRAGELLAIKPSPIESVSSFYGIILIIIIYLPHV